MSFTKSLLLGSAAVLATVVGAQAADLPSKKAAPATYVKICDAYGAGFYTIPGTDTCIKVGGYVRVDYDYRPERKNTVMVPAVSTSSAVNGAWLNAAGDGLVYGTTKPDGARAQVVAPVAAVTAASAYTTNNANSSSADTTTSGFYNRGTIQLDARTPTSMGVARTYMALRMETGAGLLGKTQTGASLESAFVQWAGFTFGQGPQPAAFMSSWAYNTHYWGGWPNGVRQLSYTAILGGGISATLGVTDAGNYNTVATAPTDARDASLHTPGYNGIVYVGNVRYDQSWGSAQVFGAFHSGGNVTSNGQYASNATNVGGNTNGGAATAVIGDGSKEGGWALGVGASFKLPMLAAGDELQLTFVYNDRLQNIIGDASINTPSSSAYGLNPVGGPAVSFANGTGWVAGGQLRHFWASNFRSQIYVSYTARSQHDFKAKSTDSANTIGGSGNAWSLGKAFIYSPAKDFDIGLEVNYIRANWDQAALRTVTGGTWSSRVGDLTESNVVTKLRVQRNF